MFIQYLDSRDDFPDPEKALDEDLLAIGGELTVDRLIRAYSKGIFPWYSKDTPVLWWSPDPRLILEPEDLHVSRRLARQIRQKLFSVSVNFEFERVIYSCAEVSRKEGQGTWIVPEMIKAYCALHDLGYAHSLEAWCKNELCGGLYGVCLGKVFFGESMFFCSSNASKVAFVNLVWMLKEYGFQLIDCQQSTSHLKSFGAKEISRKEFLQRLKRAVNVYTNQEEVWRPRVISSSC